MKSIYKILTVGAAMAAMVSCDLNQTPRFDDCNDAFAAFDVTSVTVNENAGTVSIPVTVASRDPRTVAVAYTTTDGTAKAGVNYEVSDASAVLQFDGTSRTEKVVIDITDLAGEYTGDLSFTVSLVSAGDLNLGANATCTVRISDLDHPLAAILGGYTAKVFNYFDGADAQWSTTFDKDESDISVVWIYGITESTGSDGVYGNVATDPETGDFTTITIPFGQAISWNASYDAMFVGFKSGGYYMPEGSLVLTKTADGWVNEDPDWGWGWLVYTKGNPDAIAGWAEAYMPGGTFTKN